MTTRTVVTAEMMDTFITRWAPPVESPRERISPGPGASFDVEGFLARHPETLRVAHQGPWNGGQRWGLAICPWNPDHTNGSAYLLRFASGAVAAGCHHNGCAGKDWRALRDLLEPGRAWTSSSAPTSPSPSADPEPWEPPLPLPSTTAGPEFPIESLPPAIRLMVENVAANLQVPVALPAALAIAAAAGAAARKVDVEVRPGWVEPLNLFWVAVLPSGEGKSPAYALMMRPLELWESAEIDRMGPIIRAAQTEHDILEKRLVFTKEKAAKATDPGGQFQLLQDAKSAAEALAQCRVPAYPRILADDITPEKTISLLAEQDGRLVVASPEGGVFGTLAGRYSTTPNLDAFLKGHSGDALRVDRATRASEVIQRPALTVALCVQPGVITRLSDTPEFRENGLLARFLYALPSSRVGARDHAHAPTIDPQIQRVYESIIGRLLEIPMPIGDPGTMPATRKLELSPSASQALVAFRAELEPQLRIGGRLERIADWTNKAAGTTARLAGLLHLLSLRSWDEPISLDTMTRAIDLGHYLLEHALVAFRAMGRDPAFEGAVRVLAWIRQQGTPEVSQRDILRAHDTTYPTIEALRPALGMLVERGYLRPKKLPTGGRPAIVYEVNPLLPPAPDPLGTKGQKGQKPPVAWPDPPSVPSVPSSLGVDSPAGLPDWVNPQHDVGLNGGEI